MISVVVVDDERLVRSGFAALLASIPRSPWSGRRSPGMLPSLSYGGSVRMSS